MGLTSPPLKSNKVMAQVKSKFNIGDQVVTVDKNSLKIKKFEVAEIAFFLYKDRMSVSLYPKKENGDADVYSSVDENLCFATETDLIEHMTKN